MTNRPSTFTVSSTTYCKVPGQSLCEDTILLAAGKTEDPAYLCKLPYIAVDAPLVT